MKQGILLVAFGAGNAQSTATLRRVQTQTEARFQLPVRWAFTSDTMRARLAQERTKSDSVLKALRRMRFDRYTHIAVQSLHLIPGLEYSGVLGDIRLAVSEGSLEVQAGRSLLTTPEDVVSAARALIRHLPKERKADEAVVCMAHGSKHEAETCYAEWAHVARALDPGVHVACMKGSLTLDRLLPELLEARTPKIWLLPLLSVVGKHTLQDMAGSKPQSWKSRLEAAGFLCTADLRGLADGPDFVGLWLDRLAEALQAFAN